MWFLEARRVKTRLRPMQKVPYTQICESRVCGTIFQQTFGFTNLEVMENLWSVNYETSCHIVNSVKQHSGVNLFQRPSDFTNLEGFENPRRQQWGMYDYSTLCHNSVVKPSFITSCFPARCCHHLQGILTRVTSTLLCKKCGKMVFQPTSSFTNEVFENPCWAFEETALEPLCGESIFQLISCFTLMKHNGARKP